MTPSRSATFVQRLSDDDRIAKALATLRAEGLIITGRRTITIPSTDRLNRFADR